MLNKIYAKFIHLKVAVLKGGWSLEREVSLVSGNEIEKALKELGHEVYLIDVQKNLEQLIEDLKTIKPDIVFNALHGKGGEDGTIQSILDFLCIPYTHSSITSSATAMNKYLSKQIFEFHSIPVPKSKLLTKEEYKNSNLKLPYVIKPVDEGSSFGVKIILNHDDEKNAKKNWSFDYALVEEFLDGREITVGVLNDNVLGTLEIIYKNEFYDFEAKYTDGASTHLTPAPLEKHEEDTVCDLALKAHKALMCSGVSRSDFIFANNTFYLLELNTQPGMTPISLLPDIAKSKGLFYKDVVNQILMFKKNKI
jgi:D-alanine-D-alanine ligase